MTNEVINIGYKPGGKVSSAFLKSKAKVRGLRGPIGSGKSVACCAEIFRRACLQEQGVDGMRKTRWAVIRNTYPELKSTTIRTWLDWFSEKIFGKMNWEVPFTHRIRFGDVELEVIFLALDRPDHVKKLLSLEITGAWINEARELPKAIIDAAIGRTGRFPSQRDRPAHIHKDRWPTWHGMIMDTNSPDDDHWWYVLAERDTSTERNAQIVESITIAEKALREQGLLGPDQPLFEFFSQPSGLSEAAENKKNIVSGYYEVNSAGKTQTYIDVYVHGKYGSVQDGKPIYPEFNDQVHVFKENREAIVGVQLLLGWDFGLTPACAVCQMTPRGQFRILDEIVGIDIGIKNFAKHVKKFLSENYPGWRLKKNTGTDQNFIENIGDPAGVARDGDERTAFDLMRDEGFEVDPAKTNSFAARRETTAGFMSTMVDGEPAFGVNPRCKVIKKGLGGAYKYRRLLVAGDERYTDEPDKNSYSHPCEAGQYAAMKYYRPPSEDQQRAGYRGHKAASKAGY